MRAPPGVLRAAGELRALDFVRWTTTVRLPHSGACLSDGWIPWERRVEEPEACAFVVLDGTREARSDPDDISVRASHAHSRYVAPTSPQRSIAFRRTTARVSAQSPPSRVTGTWGPARVVSRCGSRSARSDSRRAARLSSTRSQPTRVRSTPAETRRVIFPCERGTATAASSTRQRHHHRALTDVVLPSTPAPPRAFLWPSPWALCPRSACCRRVRGGTSGSTRPGRRVQAPSAVAPPPERGDTPVRG